MAKRSSLMETTGGESVIALYIPDRVETFKYEAPVARLFVQWIDARALLDCHDNVGLVGQQRTASAMEHDDFCSG